MKMIKSLVLGSAASVLAMAGAQAADLPVKAKAVEYVKVCSLYGAGFWYIPGTDTCIRIGGTLRVDTAINGGIYDNPFWSGIPSGQNATQGYNKDWYTTRARLNLTEDTRTNTEYGVLRTYGNVQFDWTRGVSGIAGGAPVEVDYAFIQFAGFTFGKAVSQFDPQWALAKPTISSGFWAGSNNATGIPQLSYAAVFGNGLLGIISLEDAQPYRTAGVVNGANPTLNLLAANSPTQGGAVNYGLGNFTGNASGGDHIPDIVGSLKLDQAWGGAFISAAGHEVHGTYYGADSTTGHPNSTWGYAASAGFELKNLPTGQGDSFKAETTWAHGAAKYVFGGTLDTSGAGRFFRLSGTNPGATGAFAYILDGVYSGTNALLPGATNIQLSNAWEVSAYYEHYWNAAWRTSLFANYSTISYGQGVGSASALLLAGLSNPAQNAIGTFQPAGGVNAQNIGANFYQIGTRTAWTPVKDLVIAAEFLYSNISSKMAGTFTNTAAAAGVPAGTVIPIQSQNIFNGAVQISRAF